MIHQFFGAETIKNFSIICNFRWFFSIFLNILNFSMLSRNVVAVRGAHKAASSATASKPVEKVTKLGNGLTVGTIDSKKPLTQLVSLSWSIYRC